MARHSKNNTALGFFTYEEKKKAQYGTKKQRVGKDSMRKFDACYLCLQKARSPLSCSRGHVACRECVVEHILSQKTSIARQTQLAKAQIKADEKDAKLKEQEKVAKELESFERLQSQVTSVKAIAASNEERTKGLKRSAEDTDSNSGSLRLGEGYAKSNLPSFWVPALTPNVQPSKPIMPTNEKKLIQCTAAEPHSISMKKMISIHFEFNQTKDEPICPSCLKVLTNAHNPVLLTACGHVLCKSCTTKFVIPSCTCFTCQSPCPTDLVDRIALVHDGTGFASGGGKVTASRFGLAFQ